MIFLGYAFAGGPHSFDASAVTGNSATSAVLSNGVFDEFYMTSDVLSYSNTIPSSWDFHTLLHANFNGNLLAGNIDFAVSEVDVLRLKRRIKGTTNWVILYEQPVSNKDDLTVVYYDKTCRANTTYQYTLVPVFDQVEGKSYTSEITTDFQGLFVIDRDNVFQTELDVKFSNSKRSKPRSVITPIGSKYPQVVSNSTNNYDSGTVSAEWIKYNQEDDSWDTDNAISYIDNLKDFLNNEYPKLIKYQDGRMWLADISSSEIIDEEDDAHMQIHTSFDFVEIADCDSGSDLYANGFIDVDQ